MSETIAQGSAEWFAARLGKVTASRMADVVAMTKKGPGMARLRYMEELTAERLTGRAVDHFQSKAMEWGTAHEGAARTAYEFLAGVDVERTGFIDHPTLAMSGASPDALVGADGLAEIKCPTTATHIEYILGGAVPADYEPQMVWQMACTGRAWNDFVSFDPRMPRPMDLFVMRLHRDPERIAELEESVLAFLAEVDARVTSVCMTYGRSGPRRPTV